MIFAYLNSLDPLHISFISLKQLFIKLSVIEEFFNLGYLSNSLKTFILNIIVPLCTSKSATSFRNFSFFSKPTENFPLIICYRYNSPPFRFKNLFIPFNKLCSIFWFVYFSGLLVGFFCFNCVAVNNRIKKLFSYFFLIQPLYFLLVFKAFSQL